MVAKKKPVGWRGDSRGHSDAAVLGWRRRSGLPGMPPGYKENEDFQRKVRGILDQPPGLNAREQRAVKALTKRYDARARRATKAGKPVPEEDLHPDIWDDAVDDFGVDPERANMIADRVLDKVA